MRIKLIIEYDGTAYGGWQVQDNAPTVQAEIEFALKKLTGQHIGVYGAGRTDSGVHARGQAAHFDIDSSIPPEKFSFVLNTMLPADIRIRSSEQVPETFHARYHAKGKEYVYRIYNAPHASAIERNTTMHVPSPLNMEKMRTAAGYMVGTFDFSAFCAAGSVAKTTVRSVYAIEITEQSPLIAISVKGNGFLYNMVRIIAGTLIEVGKGKLDPEQLPHIIACGDRKLAGMTAEPQGLTLEQVFY